jgi:tetratricopeptide (TPR) repeat protein
VKGERDKGTKGQSVKWEALFFFFLMSVVCSPAHSEPLVLTAEDQFAFARQHFENSEYEKAIVEFERFIHFFPADERVGSALRYLAQARFQLGRYPKAIEAAGEHIRRNTDDAGIDVTPAVVESIWLAAEAYEELGQTERSLAILHRLLAETDDPAVEDATWFRIGWVHIERREWEKAGKAFGTVTEEGRTAYPIPALLEKLEEADEIPEKIPGLAGTLSLIPGAGYLYLGRYRDAATAFLLNAALIGATWEAFDNGNEILGGLLGVVEAGFYSGNIYGSVSSAHKYNRDQVQEFIDGLGSLAMGKKRHSSTGIQAFARRDRVGVMLRLRY